MERLSYCTGSKAVLCSQIMRLRQCFNYLPITPAQIPTGAAIKLETSRGVESDTMALMHAVAAALTGLETVGAAL